MHTLHVIGTVQSTIKSIADAPLQENEGAPSATILIHNDFLPALAGIRHGDKLVILTWLHKGDRSTLTTHPRNDPRNGVMGVFATRSPDRPNPIGFHVAVVTSVEGDKLTVSNLEAIDGTPVIDIKPYLER